MIFFYDFFYDFLVTSFFFPVIFFWPFLSPEVLVSLTALCCLGLFFGKISKVAQALGSLSLASCDLGLGLVTSHHSGADTVPQANHTVRQQQL